MEREHIYNASNHDGTLNAVIRWNIGGVDLIVDGKRKANALHFHGYRSATLANQRELNQTVECLLSVLTADTLKDGLKWALSCFPWAREVQTIGKYKGETTNAEGTQIKWYVVFTEEKLTVSLSGDFKLVNVRRSYTTPPTQEQMQDIITDVQQLLALPLNEALKNIRLLFHSEKYECFKRDKPEPQPQPKREKPKPKQDKPKREKPKPKQDKPKREKTEPRPKQEKPKRENTQAEMRKIMDEYFAEDVGGGWRMFLRRIQRNGRKVYNVEIGFNLYLDDPDRIITVVCPTEISDGTPQVTWEKDFRELLDRIANDFTGDITETLTNLEKIANENENRRKKTNLQEFAEKLDEYNLKKYKKYATQVTWDEWEIRMMAEEEERKNKLKQTIKTDGDQEKERTTNN